MLSRLTEKLFDSQKLTVFILVALGILLYFPGLNTALYGDDPGIVIDSPSSKIFYFFTHNNPSNFYRPTEFTFQAISQSIFGPATPPIHVAALLSHLALSLLVYFFALHSGLKKNQAFLAGFFMALSQANVHPVASNDTLSQVWSALFGFLSIYFLLRRQNILSWLSFALALFSKEAALAFLPILLLFKFFEPTNINLEPWRSKFRAANIKNTLIKITPYLILVILFMVARFFISHIQPSFGPGRYQFHIGFNIAKNIASLIFAGIIPASTVAAFRAITTLEFLKLGFILGATALLLGFIVWGIYKLKERKLTYLLAASALLSFFPMAALNRVSELHIYNGMPFIAIIFGASLGQLWEEFPSKKIWREALAVFIILLFASHTYAVEAKLSLMRQNGDRMNYVLAQLGEYQKNWPRRSKVFLVNPHPLTPEYSIFLINGFNILDNEESAKHLIGRDDLNLKIVEEGQLAQPEKGAYILTIDQRGKISTYQP